MRRFFGLALALAVPAYAQLNFVALGGLGASNTGSQRSVASTLKLSARDKAYSFIVSPGSCFAKGVHDVNDTQWATHFRKPYESKELNVPFFTVLGEEDWRGNHSALVAYTNNTYERGAEDAVVAGPKWTLPNWWYHYSTHFADASQANSVFGPSDSSVGFVFLDTAILKDSFRFANITKLHWDELRASVAAAARVFDWVIAVGDRALLSSGASKGDAELSSTLRPLLKDAGVDAYISGSDHDLEVIEDGPLVHVNCGSGVAGDMLPRAKVENSVAYSGRPGFCDFRLTRDALKVALVDGSSGETIANYTKARQSRTRSLLHRFNIYMKQPENRYVPVPDELGPQGSRDDWFVRVVGSLGLTIASFLILLALSTGGHKLYRAID